MEIDPSVTPGTNAHFELEVVEMSTGERAHTFSGFTVVAVSTDGTGPVQTLLLESLTPLVRASNDEPTQMRWRITNTSNEEQNAIVEIGPITDPLSEAFYLDSEVYDILDFFIASPRNQQTTGIRPTATDGPPGGPITMDLTLAAGDEQTVEIDLTPGEFCEFGMQGCCPFRVTNPDTEESSNTLQYVVNTTENADGVHTEKLTFAGEATERGTLFLRIRDQEFNILVKPGTTAAELSNQIAKRINALPARTLSDQFPVNAMFNFNAVALTGVEPGDWNLFMEVPHPGLSVARSGFFNDIGVEGVEVVQNGDGRVTLNAPVRIDPVRKIPGMADGESQPFNPNQPIALRAMANGTPFGSDHIIETDELEEPTVKPVSMSVSQEALETGITLELDPDKVHHEVEDSGRRNNSQQVVPKARPQLTLAVDGRRIELSLTADPGQRFILERSTDLNAWEDVEAIAIPDDGEASLQLEISPEVRTLFYRARLAE